MGSAQSATADFTTTARSGDEPLADLLYDAFYGAAVGGSTIAIFFLVVDLIAGHPLFTPSLIGTVLVTGADAAAVTEVRLDMVAYFSAAHFGSFLALGAVVSLMCRWTGLSKTSPRAVVAVVFTLLTAGFLVGGRLLIPGVGAVIGLPAILAANLVTAFSMAAFLKWAHEE